MVIFAEKKIAIGVTGGIAAYKTCDLIRELKRLGAEVRVAMTAAARKFVSELTFATLSENPVVCSLFEDNEATGIVHIELARWCDVLLISPATANVIGKTASGLADEVLSTLIVATKAPVIFCPAMNSTMWANPIVQENIAKLTKHGFGFVEPEWGELASKSEGEGMGRLAGSQRIIQKLKYTLLATGELKGKKVLVTAGATREPIDAVRFITNYSSGKMGFALAEAAKLKGAEVVIVAGANQLEKIEGIKYIEVNTVEEMKDAVNKEYKNSDILFMAAAVSDFKPKQVLTHKLKKTSHEYLLELQTTSDILAELGAKKDECIHVGFALETENGTTNATKKLRSKNLDLIVLNSPLEAGAAFAVDTNKVTIISKDGETEELPLLPKTTVANILIEKLCESKKYIYSEAVIG